MKTVEVPIELINLAIIWIEGCLEAYKWDSDQREYAEFTVKELKQHLEKGN